MKVADKLHEHLSAARNCGKSLVNVLGAKWLDPETVREALKFCETVDEMIAFMEGVKSEKDRLIADSFLTHRDILI